MKRVIFLALTAFLVLSVGCAREKPATELTSSTLTETSAEATSEVTSGEQSEASDIPDAATDVPSQKQIYWDDSLQYADFSKIHSSAVTLYYAEKSKAKNITVCVNAGHGTRGGSAQKTYCHPDKTPKVTGGSTGKGVVTATSVNEGMTFLDGTREADANLSLALLLKDRLLAAGYNVLMIRESEDVQLDNIARTVIANNNADCHISLHYDSTATDKGLFFIGVPDVASYRAMEPVASHYGQHTALGEALVKGERSVGVKIFSKGRLDIDLTQTSFSTIPSVDLEVGDKKSDHSKEAQSLIADGIVEGADLYFGK